MSDNGKQMKKFLRTYVRLGERHLIKYLAQTTYDNVEYILVGNSFSMITLNYGGTFVKFIYSH